MGPRVRGDDVRRLTRHVRAFSSRLLLHVLDAREHDALGAFAGVVEIELVLGQKYRIAIDIVGDAGAIGRDERVELLAVVGRNPARELELADLEIYRQRVFRL